MSSLKCIVRVVGVNIVTGQLDEQVCYTGYKFWSVSEAEQRHRRVHHLLHVVLLHVQGDAGLMTRWVGGKWRNLIGRELAAKQMLSSDWLETQNGYVYYYSNVIFICLEERLTD